MYILQYIDKTTLDHAIVGFFFAVCDSLVCPYIETGWCQAGIIEHFELWPKMSEIHPKSKFDLQFNNFPNCSSVMLTTDT